MLKDFQKIYKLLKSSRKFDIEPPKSPRGIDNHPANSGRSSDSPNQLTDEPTTTIAPSGKQQGTLSTPSNEAIIVEIQRSTKIPSFFKRLYTALYIDALLFVLVQANSAHAAPKLDEQSSDDIAVTNPEDLPLVSLSSPLTGIVSPSENEVYDQAHLSINDFIDPTEKPITLNIDTKEGKFLSLLDNLATHDNFKILDTSRLQSKASTRLSKYSEDNQLQIFDTDDYIIIELDDDDLLYSDEDLALFSMDDYNFLLVNNDLLSMFNNNTEHNSWESLKPGEEYYILQQDDIFEDDIEIITVDEEIYLDENNQISQPVSVDYFVYEDTVIGMVFTLPDDFYQTHASIDFETLFA
ncbi:MAG: hypothetical protein V7776_09130 [Halopseudomonas aestusnigri]